jgi:hypothetical protein
VSAAPRWRPSGHHWDRSCSPPRWPAAVPGRPVLGPASPHRTQHHRCVRSLAQVHADHHHRRDLPFLPFTPDGTAAGMPCSGPVIVAPLTSHAATRSGRPARRSEDRKPIGSGYESQPCGTSERYDLTRNARTDPSIRRPLCLHSAKGRAWSAGRDDAVSDDGFWVSADLRRQPFGPLQTRRHCSPHTIVRWPHLKSFGAALSILASGFSTTLCLPRLA